jgi:hypothetical protein
MSGTFQQVVGTFDAVSDLINVNFSDTPAASPKFRVVFLVSNHKAVRILGPNGDALLSLKNRSTVDALEMTQMASVSQTNTEV